MFYGRKSHLDNIEISILNYENQLLENRKQLNNLICDYNNQKISNTLLTYKINYLQKEIDYMNHQLDILKTSLNEQVQASQMQSQNTVHLQPPYMQMQNSVQPQTPQTQPQAPQKQLQEPQIQPQTPQMQPQNTAHKKTDLENVIGKSWMGIFASVLIFVSFILFATLLAPFITDTVKMTAMYIVSISFTLFGLIKLKNKHNKLYLAISGCGIGAIYISLLLTNMYFKAIGDITLYIFLLVWAVFVCYLSRWRDRAFQVIGQSGITIAILFGVLLCVDAGDTDKFFLLSLFFAVTAAAFYVSNYDREFHKNIVNNVFNIINVLQFALGTDLLVNNSTGTVMLTFLILQFILFFTSKLKENNTGFGVLTIINAMLMMRFISDILNGQDMGSSVRGAVFIFIGLILLAVIEKKFAGRKDGRKDDGKVLLQLFVLPLFVFSVYMISFLGNHIGLSFIMLLFILLGYYKNDNIYKFESLFMSVVYFFGNMKYPLEHFCLGLLFFAVLAAFMYVKKEQYNIKFKLLSYIIGFVFICGKLIDVLNDIDISYDISVTIILAVAASLNVLAMHSSFIKDFQTLQIEKPCINVTRIINAGLMAYSLYAVMDADSEMCHCILILLSIFIFMVNTKNLLEQNKGLWPGIYIGVKLTILLTTILCSFDAANYVISISAFLFAIISIVIGFIFSLKAFRIYGLILSLFSVAKLILVDISYDNTLGHALSFFICGILCFVISMIYHLIDKKVHCTSP